MESLTNKARKAVIVRSHADRPVKLYLHRKENNTFYVGKLDSDTCIGVRSSDVFEWNGEQFESLIRAFSDHDLHSLHSLYDHLPLDDFHCNKYQNNVLSNHDQEALRSTE